jgi:hypothetical protein
LAANQFAGLFGKNCDTTRQFRKIPCDECARPAASPRSHWPPNAETLRRLGIAPAHLLDYYVKILVHINSQLDRASAAIKLAAGFLE